MQGVGGRGRRLGPVAAGGGCTGGRWGRPGSPRCSAFPLQPPPAPRGNFASVWHGRAGAGNERGGFVCWGGWGTDAGPSTGGALSRRCPASGGIAGSARRPRANFVQPGLSFVGSLGKCGQGAGRREARDRAADNYKAPVWGGVHAAALWLGGLDRCFCRHCVSGTRIAKLARSLGSTSRWWPCSRPRSEDGTAGSLSSGCWADFPVCGGNSGPSSFLGMCLQC